MVVGVELIAVVAVGAVVGVVKNESGVVKVKVTVVVVVKAVLGIVEVVMVKV